METEASPQRPKRVRKPLRLETHKVVRWTEKGLGRTVGGKSVDLFGVYPGEELEVLVGQRGNAWPSRVLVPSPDRREPICPHFGSCGGCTLQSLDYTAQLALKTANLNRKLLELDPEMELLAPVPSPDVYHYRSKVEFSFQKTDVGFHWRGRFDHVVNVERCFLAPQPHAEILRRTREWAREHGLVGHNPRTHEGPLRYMIFRRASGGDWLAVLIVSPEVTRERAMDWAHRLQDLQPRALVWATQTSIAGAVKPDSQELLYGEPYLRETLGHLNFRLSWQSFFQSNPRAYLKLLETAREWANLKSGDSLLDLFCGIGTIGLFLQPEGGKLTGVESVPEAIVDAHQAAELNGRVGDFHCAQAQDWTDLNTDLLVLDPPRSGCHPKLIERLLTEGPQRILYISCNPNLWIKEAQALAPHYRIVKAQPFDFFPHTRHVELLALLERRA